MTILQQLLNRLLHKAAFILPGGYSLRPWMHRLRGAHIGRDVWISQYVYLDELHPEGIIIHDNCTIGLRTSLITHLYWGERKATGGYKEIIIEKNAYIGPNCLILPGSRIGEGSVIKGGTTVTGHVPAFTLWGMPNPGPLARITVPLTRDHAYEDFVHGLRPAPQRKARS